MGRKYKGRVHFKVISFSLCCVLLFTNCKGGYLNSSLNTVVQPSEQEQLPLDQDTNVQEQLPLDQDTNGQEQLPLDQDPNKKTHQFSITQLAYTNTKLDMLWFIDNSPSMDDTHEELRHSFDNLFSQELQSIDWQMAFTSIEPGSSFYSLKDSNGQNLTGEPRILSSSTSNFEEIFKNTISSRQSGPWGSYYELQSVFDKVNSLENDLQFLRSDALLAVILVSDELDQSPQSPLDIIEAVEDNFGQSKKFLTYGLIIEPGDVTCIETQKAKGGWSVWASINYKVAELVRLTGGITGSICEEDYSFMMANIGDHIQKELLFKDVSLEHNNVIEDSINLTFTPDQNKQSWEFDSQTNKIVFDIPPIEDTKVHISYNYRSELNN